MSAESSKSEVAKHDSPIDIDDEEDSSDTEADEPHPLTEGTRRRNWIAYTKGLTREELKEARDADDRSNGPWQKEWEELQPNYISYRGNLPQDSPEDSTKPTERKFLRQLVRNYVYTQHTPRMSESKKERDRKTAESLTLVTQLQSSHLLGSGGIHVKYPKTRAKASMLAREFLRAKFGTEYDGSAIKYPDPNAGGEGAKIVESKEWNAWLLV